MKNKNVYFILLIAFMGCLFQANAAKRQMEYLERGLVAVKSSTGVFLSWRLLGNDDPKIQFNVYRGSVKLNTTPLTGATNYTDAAGTTASTYRIGIVDPETGEETSRTSLVSTWTNFYKRIQLKRPADVVYGPTSTYKKDTVFTYTPNDCSVGDLDGDGEYEIIVKWDPSNSKDNANSNYSEKVYIDAYKLNGTFLWRIDLGKNIRAGAHYTQFMVYDFDGDGIAEVACKTAPGTIDGLGNNVIMGSDNPNADYRNANGYIITGPEYLTVFDGKTGAERHTVAYKPLRGTVSAWGDSNGNRVDRFLACVAYLDGVHPSLVMCRGYYTRTTLAAYDFKDGKLVERWFHDSPTSGQGAYGQGNHNLSVADVDGDGFDEIIYGSCAIDHDGKLLYRTGLGHGDAMHVSKLDPDRPGLQVFSVHESTSAAYGYEMHDAATGQILWGAKTGSDNGRGIAADIDPNHRGFEMWSASGAGVYNCKGEKIADNKPQSTSGSDTYNFRIYWDGDLQDELLDRQVISKWNPVTKTTGRVETLYNYDNATFINGSKSNPCLVADILGDWREEIICYRSADPSQLLIFTTNRPTEHRLYTLMHDPTYRLAIAWQNVAYNQPPHLGFYIGDGVDDIPWPDMYTYKDVASGLNDVKQDVTQISLYNREDGSIDIQSKDEIRSIAVYSLTGNLLMQKNAIGSTYYNLSGLSVNRELVVIKVTTDTETKSFKRFTR